ncbi:hypothetical protein FZC66_11355 [Priestia megaterium]|nr:hypothetical protein FZC66_11355 [Priestia megaterium]
MSSNKQEQMATDDAVVLMFLSLVEEDGMEIGVTLNINGLVVSGTLIGARAYYDGIIESYKELNDRTMSKILTKKFSDLKDGYLKQKQEQEDKDNKGNSATFIHLKEAKYLGANHQSISNKSTWWRGRISSIDGFSFDALG